MYISQEKANITPFSAAMATLLQKLGDSMGGGGLIEEEGFGMIHVILELTKCTGPFLCFRTGSLLLLPNLLLGHILFGILKLLLLLRFVEVVPFSFSFQF